MNNRQRKVAKINNIEVLLQNTNCLLAVMKLAKMCREESVGDSLGQKASGLTKQRFQL